MKRLHIVGKSKDNKRLFLAKTRGAKFGSFEIPIGQKLLKLVREVEEARGDRGRPPPKQEEEVGAPPEATPATPASPASPAPASPASAPPAAGAPADGRPTEGPARPGATDRDIDLPVGSRPPREERPDGGTAVQPDAAPEPVPAPEPAAPEPDEEEEAVDAGLPGQRFRERLRGRTRQKRPEIPSRSSLTPAEIQTLIRAGRSVRSVAQLAGTSTAWIRWLAEPVEQERMGIVFQALQQRQHRARLGPSAEPLGVAVVQNLRTRGVAAPERIVDEGFSALRDGREWRVRLTYQHRGRRVNADWSFDPQSKELVAVNTLATHLGWREPPSENGLPEDRIARRTPRSRGGGRRAASKRTAAKAASSKRTAGKRTSRKRTAAKPTSPRKTSARRTKTTAAKRTSPRKTSTRRTKTTSAKRTSAAGPAKRTASKRTAAARTTARRSSRGSAASSRGSGGRRTSPSRPRRRG